MTEIIEYQNKYNEKEDLDRLNFMANELEETYLKELKSLNDIKKIYESSIYLNKEIDYFDRDNLFDYEKSLIKLKSHIWKKALRESFVYKYFSEDQRAIIVSQLGIIGESLPTPNNKEKKECVEPTAENIMKYFSFIILSKESMVNKNLFEAIKRNAFKVERKHNKPLEFTDFVIFDCINDYSMNGVYNVKEVRSIHKALCAFFDLDYNKYDSIERVLYNAKIEPLRPIRSFEDKDRREEVKKEINHRRKIKYDYLPGMKIQFFKNTFRIYFDKEQRDKLNKEIIEVYKSSLIG